MLHLRYGNPRWEQDAAFPRSKKRVSPKLIIGNVAPTSIDQLFERHFDALKELASWVSSLRKDAQGHTRGRLLLLRALQYYRENGGAKFVRIVECQTDQTASSPSVARPTHHRRKEIWAIAGIKRLAFFVGDDLFERRRPPGFQSPRRRRKAKRHRR
jgi:hypothetical protein